MPATPCTNSAATIVATSLVLWLGATPTPAHAQSSQTYVSANGSDASATCSRSAPCRTFANALTKTLAAGEIIVLDPASYGTVTINKSISIINDGVGEASIRPAAGAIGITIAAAATDTVYLRGLIIDGGGTAFRGIHLTAGKSLIVENCVIRNFTGATADGIRFQPTASGNLVVSNTRVANSAGVGVFVAPSGSGTVTAALNRIETHNNSSGVYLNGNGSTGVVSGTVTDSVATSNALSGFAAESSAGHAPTTLTVVRSVSANNGTGMLAAGTNALVRTARSTATGNAVGWAAGSGGVLLSYADNYIDGNTNDGGLPPTIPTR